MSAGARAGVEARVDAGRAYFSAVPAVVPDLAAWLVAEQDCDFATLVVEQADGGFVLRYFFVERAGAGLAVIETHTAADAGLPSISDRVHAADWHEREAEDLFEIRFHGHPFLGDFVLHDTVWPEGVAPMRHDFDARRRSVEPGRGDTWAPRRLLREPGALAFPVGPVWGDYHEAGLWLLETPGEQIRQAHSRLFYKYRGVEKIAEGAEPAAVVRLAERFSGSAAFAHALACCQALEAIAGVEPPPRAKALRVLFAELERMRNHAATVAELAGSTALAVGKAMAQEIEEDLLRLSGAVTGHRYLFGLLGPGGLARDLQPDGAERLAAEVPRLAARLRTLAYRLSVTSSFLDRIEEMGTLTPELAADYGAVGPVGRASGRTLDLRCLLPYADYAGYAPAVASEVEGDGYARLRVFFREVEVASELIRDVVANVPRGPACVPWQAAAGEALGWAEAPAGATFHWLRLDDAGRVARWRIAPPSFRNWHAFHRAVEGAAFQDFPIILASFGLSVAESDR